MLRNDGRHPPTASGIKDVPHDKRRHSTAPRNAPFLSIDRYHAQEAERAEQTKQQDMSNMAIWYCMRNCPKRCRPQYWVSCDANDVRMVRIEGFIIVGCDRYRIGYSCAECEEQTSEGHCNIRDPHLPRRILPRGYVKGAVSCYDQPAERKNRDCRVNPHIKHFPNMTDSSTIP
jgi:hypothetical protein